MFQRAKAQKNLEAEDAEATKAGKNLSCLLGKSEAHIPGLPLLLKCLKKLHSKDTYHTTCLFIFVFYPSFSS